MQALKIAATGMAAQQMRVDVTAHNISNMSTTGFNARRAEFSDLHYQQIRTPGTVTAGTGEILPSGFSWVSGCARPPYQWKYAKVQ